MALAPVRLSGCEFAPVVVTEGCGPPAASRSDSGRMEIMLGNGRSIVVDARVDAAALARVNPELDLFDRRRPFRTDRLEPWGHFG